MSLITKRINNFFRGALRKDINRIKSEIVLSERQKKIFDMFYIQRKDINYIADTLCVCRMVINNELKIIRTKVAKILNIENT